MKLCSSDNPYTTAPRFLGVDKQVLLIIDLNTTAVQRKLVRLNEDAGGGTE